MDDLLALMEGGDDLLPPEPEEPVNTRSPSNSSSTVRNVTPHNADNNNGHHAGGRPATKKAKKKTAAETGEAQVDSILKMRMLDRKVGSLDLLEYIQTRNYQSPAALGAMCLAALNHLLIDPALVVSPANVHGNTNLFTVGLVFTNSGTKIAAKGNAFCVLTMGSNINTGPSVTVLLFGAAFSKFCREIKPGMVVALDNPRLIPAKEPQQNSKFVDTTSISFSINDERRIFVVAKARDFGVCQATVKGKNSDGHWVNNAKRCNTVIDVRAGKYCHHHRNQANAAANQQGNGKGAKKGTFVQQLRHEVNTQAPSKGGQGIYNPHQTLVVSKQMRGVPMQMSKGKAPTDRQPRADSFNRPIALQRNPKLASNGILNFKAKENPYAKKGPARPTPSSSNNQRAPLGSNRSKTAKTNKEAHNWLATTTGKRQRLPQATPGSSRQGPTGRKSAVKLNTVAMGGFDGSVAVPKPSRMFASAGGPNNRGGGQSLFAQTAAAEQQSASDILSRQTELAKQLRGAQNGKDVKATNLNKKKKSAQDSADASGFFGSSLVQNNATLQNMDRAAVMNTKSRFASEADAEAYAESRRRVTELEQEEARKDKTKGKAQQQLLADQKKVVDKEWICKTCSNKRFKKEPKVCLRARHDVVLKRILNKKDETVAEKRSKLTSRSVQDGGLTLGSGIEWTRFSRFSH